MHRRDFINAGLFLVLCSLAAGALVLGAITARPDRPIGDAFRKDPAVPEEVKDNHRCDPALPGDCLGLEQGPRVGATPNKAYPRPDSWLKDRGHKYGFYTVRNWSGRGAGSPIEAIVVHVTGPGTLEGMRAWFDNEVAQASAHFGVGKRCAGSGGEVDQYIEIGDVAWHAGIWNRPALDNWLIASWYTASPRINPNHRTIGIELLLQPGEVIGSYPCQAAAFDDLLLWLVTTLRIAPDRIHIIGHFEIDSVNRPQDPVCCWWPEGGVAYLQARLAPPAPPGPIDITIEDLHRRVCSLEARAGLPPSVGCPID